MAVIAKLKYLHIAPRKVRLIADLIRGKKVSEALTQLEFLSKAAAQPIAKLLRSAVANAKHNFQLEEVNLFISKIVVDEGPKFKRWQARARGRVSEIQKKTSHLTVILEEIEKKPKKVKKERKTEEAEKAEKTPRIERLKLRPEKETPKPKIERGIKRIFKRKAF